ncbi:RNA-binding S4 domain-containing protein [Micrococcus sp. EYE_162]|uniref:RNA-binding S4 domain-containing protein n=1 Tax=unclassified Micrococcus TaxID=2620948 RepID=UPI002004DABF|nr:MULTISPECIES: RNA-binding S4 domain-containing protein [unclassified Micrococcus]MCK6095302.1 RNA-binding S4 domain-containing protein [Micrococcus sp. EYE_212]MCK6171426.1 RNA-binding S4 domain-containing protein [Micrococcus sp. EYE_162]
MSGPAGGGTVRIDAWLWAVRLYKTRSAATAAVRAGHVRVDGEPVKAAASVVVGNRIRVRQDGRERILEVTGLISKRVGAPVAVKQYVDHSPPPVPHELLSVPYRERGAGRPTKRDRRQLDALRGRDGAGRG